ncbi:tRNA uridine-5-carboxymethylaminomethyl(34) synthesis GTPase MnmE [Sphingomonas jatrophae]|uniref:tRNA uridine-5-carboxymethylaminomethyl(34) synthesis GTPase MnmE n=1 Tax=Sphingomonas jatrophae TaxID=1166337 RepID=UPI000B855C14|nr:tRNA uridine-5-carboxymethylaminomethyl(34) synthesis GTPase MnmE [Sphingomonas jatrophae]
MSGDTIFALSSGALPAGIAVVRMSGPQAGEALRHLAGALPEPRRASLRTLRDEGDALDRALILWLPGPGTATGEDMAELHLHGGRAVVAAVETALERQPKLRRAEAGEFTRRALYNDRLDLTAAEGLADLLEAETEIQRRVALAASEGGLAREVARWRDKLLGAAALVEAGIDLAAEDEAADVNLPLEAVGALTVEMEAALARPPAERLRDGIRVVLAGPVNAGKSSLLNALAGRDAAIATPVAGTTRDVLEVPLAIGGIPFLLFDTAGLRTSGDPVEAIGVERARAAMLAADILVWLDDEPAPEQHEGAIHIWPRCDLPDRAGSRNGRLAVSALTGAGLEDLRNLLVTRARDLLPREGESALNLRQRSAIAAAVGELRHALAQAADELLFAEHVRSALVRLEQVGGGGGIEDLLDTVFNRFCVGK